MTTGFSQTNEVGVFTWRLADYLDSVAFLGNDGNAIGTNSIIGTLEQSLGTREPIYAPGLRRGETVIVGAITSAPELVSLQLNERIDPNAREYLDKLKAEQCLINMVIALGKCGPTDSLNGWSKLYLIEEARANNLSYSEWQTFEATAAPLTLEGTLDAIRYGIVLPVSMGRVADSIVLAEILDVMIVNDPSCGDCKPYEEAYAGLFALANDNAGSPGLPAQIVYSIRQGKGGFNTVNVNSLSPSNAPNALLNAGQWVIVLSEADDAYHVADIGRFGYTAPLNPFSRVTTGFVVGNGPRAGWAKNPRAVLIGGANGYIYAIDNPTRGVTVLSAGDLTSEDANAVHGSGNQVGVIVGGNNTIQVSNDNWRTWNLLAGPSIGQALTSVWAKNRYVWYIGDDLGRLWLTTDGMASPATQVILPGQSAITRIDSIHFSEDSPEVGVIAARTATSGVILRTFTGGREWYDDSPAISQASDTGDYYNKAVAAGYNVIFAGGLDGSDGQLALGVGS